MPLVRLTLALRLRLRQRLGFRLELRLRRRVKLRASGTGRGTSTLERGGDIGGPGVPAKEVTKFRKIRTDEVLRI